MINVILQFLELGLVNINVSAKFYQTIPKGLRVKFHLFQNSNLGKTDPSQMSFDYFMGYIMSISMCIQNFITIFHSVQEIGPFSLFQNLEQAAMPRPMKNVISLSLGLDLVNINVYAKVYQNIPLSSRDKAIFTFSEFVSRHRLGQSQMTFDNLLGYILSISMRMQNFIRIFYSV